MDTDSFLSMLFPELNDLADSEISEYWCADDDDDDHRPRHRPDDDDLPSAEDQLPSSKTLALNPPPTSSASSSPSSTSSFCSAACTDLHLSHRRPNSTVISAITENAAQYSSVLKLSAIASALPTFTSKPPSAAADLCRGAAEEDRSDGPGGMKQSSGAAAIAARKKADGGDGTEMAGMGGQQSCPNRDFAAVGMKRSASAAQIAPAGRGAYAERESGMHRSSSALTMAMAAAVQKHPIAENRGGRALVGGNQNNYETAMAAEEGSETAEEGEEEEEEEDDDDDEDDSELDYGCGGSERKHSDEKPVSHVRIIRRPACSQVISAAPLLKGAAPNHRSSGANHELGSSVSDADTQGLAMAMKKDHSLSQREVHILSERRRRKSMRESFAVLQSLIPNLKLKNIDRITVLTEVIMYIQSLRGTLDELERRKADIMGFLGMAAEEENMGAAAAGMRQNPVAMGGGGKKRGNCDVTYVEDEEDVKVYAEAESGGNQGGNPASNVAMVEVTVRICADDIFITLNIPRRKGVWSGVLMLLQKWTVELSNATLTTTADSSFHCIHGKITNKATIEGVDLQEKIERVIIKELRKRPRKILKA